MALPKSDRNTVTQRDSQVETSRGHLLKGTQSSKCKKKESLTSNCCQVFCFSSRCTRRLRSRCCLVCCCLGCRRSRNLDCSINTYVQHATEQSDLQLTVKSVSYVNFLCDCYKCRDLEMLYNTLYQVH